VYPQPSANSYAIAGYPFFRLNTRLLTPGDLYTSEQGATAFVIGPESDIANVRIYYLDNQLQPGQMNNVLISSDRGVSGPIYAQLDQTYLPSGRPGRILIGVDDIYNPAYVPSDFTTGDDFQYVQPVLDIIQYFGESPSITPQRNDKTYDFQTTLGATVDTKATYYVLPYYGRRYASIAMQNLGADAVNLSITGVNYTIKPTATTPPAQEIAIQTVVSVASAATHTNRITAGTHGMFDALVIRMKDAAGSPSAAPPVTLRVVLSDVPEAAIAAS
jgi:hypothetical protein